MLINAIDKKFKIKIKLKIKSKRNVATHWQNIIPKMGLLISCKNKICLVLESSHNEQALTQKA